MSALSPSPWYFLKSIQSAVCMVLSSRVWPYPGIRWSSRFLMFWDFPGGPVAKTPQSQCRGSRYNTWSGKYIPHTTTKKILCAAIEIPCVATKTQHSQIRKKIFLKKNLTVYKDMNKSLMRRAHSKQPLGNCEPSQSWGETDVTPHFKAFHRIIGEGVL